MTFKIGDKVKVIQKYDDRKVGEIGTITSTSDCGDYYRINGDRYGAHHYKFEKVMEEAMFKIGDKVKVVNNDHNPNHYMVIDKVAEVVLVRDNGTLKLKGDTKHSYSDTQIVNPKCVQKVEDEFEAEWILNNGKVTIPDDAHKLMDGGSVVAFRKRKEKPLQFGDEVTGKYTGNTYKFIREENGHYDLFDPRFNTISPHQAKSSFTRK